MNEIFIGLAGVLLFFAGLVIGLEKGRKEIEEKWFRDLKSRNSKINN